MLSNFQVTDNVWLPDRCTPVLAASVKTRPVVEHADAFASHVDTCWKLTFDSVPAAPVAFVQVAAFHDTSAAAHVVAPTTGGVNAAAADCTETRSCLVAVARTMLLTVMLAALAAVLAPTLVTLNVTVDGTVTRACSLTVAVNVVVWLVSGNVTRV